MKTHSLQSIAYLLVISAPSGGGKTTLCQRLLQDFPNLTLSISSTTRPPRGVEKNGIEYFFLTHDEFEKQIQAQQFAEWAVVYGNYYGTSKRILEEILEKQQSVLLDIDVQGAKQLKVNFPSQCYRIFIAPPNLLELEKRLRNRGTDTEESIQRRLNQAKLEMQEGMNFDSVVINDRFEAAYQELKSILETKLSLFPRQK